MRPLLARIPVATLQVDLSSTGSPVGTGAWTQLIAALSTSSCAVEICNTTGSLLQISTGAPGLESASVVPYTVLPNGSSILLPLELARGARLSAKAIDNATTVGRLIFNFFG
jgi:hypothetical protein